MKNRTYLLFFLFASSLALLAACAHIGAQDAASSLEQRVAGHWHAKRTQQWDLAYDYLCADAKARVTRVQYIQGANLEISAFRIEDIAFSEDRRLSEVSIAFDMIMQGFQFNNMQLKEQWRSENNEWCLVPSGGLKTLFSN